MKSLVRELLPTTVVKTYYLQLWNIPGHQNLRQRSSGRYNYSVSSKRTRQLSLTHSMQSTEQVCNREDPLKTSSLLLTAKNNSNSFFTVSFCQLYFLLFTCAEFVQKYSYVHRHCKNNYLQVNPIQRIPTLSPDITQLLSYSQYQRRLCQHAKEKASVWTINPGFVLTPLDVRTKELTCIVEG